MAQTEMVEVTDDKPALLCTVNDHIEAAFVESLMRSNNIPIMKKWHNAGDVAMVYMAVSFFGADIFVPSKLLKTAKELLESPPLPEEFEGYEGADADYIETKEELIKDRRSKALLMVFFFVIIPVIFVLAAAAFRLYEYFLV